MPRIFSARDRRALTDVLTAGLKHAQLDELTAARPIPGDPGHDAGKAGRVGLITATVLAGADHALLTRAVEMIEAEKIPPAHRQTLARLRHKAGLDPQPATTPEAVPQPTPDATPEERPDAEPEAEPAPTPEDQLQEQPAPAAAAPAAPSPRHVPLVLVEDLAEDHPVVQALAAAGVELAHRAHADDVGPDALLLRPLHLQ